MIELTLGQIALTVNGRLKGDAKKTVSGISTDSRTIKCNELFIALRGERFDGHDFIQSLPDNISGVLCEKEFDFPVNQIIVSDTYKALGLLGAFCLKSSSAEYIVGVTGSVGKTTTKELISCVLSKKYKTHSTKGNFNNHIGLPLTLIETENDTVAVVCEMGMSAKGEIEYLSKLAHPNIAVITNIGSSHIELLGSREAIAEAKLEIVSGMKEGGWVVLDGDEPLLRNERAEKLCEGKKVIYAGFRPENDYYPLDIYKGKDFISFDVISPNGEYRVKIPAIGDHFIKDALFACVVGELCGVEKNLICDGLSSYEAKGLRQHIYEVGNISVIADCYNAAPESMYAALNVLSSVKSERKIAVFGDMLELGPISEKAHTQLGEKAAENADIIFAIGEESRAVIKAAQNKGHQCAKHFNDINLLADALKSSLQAGDCVLFKASRKMKLEEAIVLSGLAEKISI